MTERHDLWTQPGAGGVEGPRAARRARSTARRRGSSTARCSAGAGAGGVVDTRRQQGPLVRGALRVGDRAGVHAARVRPASRGCELMDEIGHLGADRLPRRRRPRRPAPRRASCDDAALRDAVPRDLQRRQRRAAGRVGQPAAARWRSCPRGTSTRACARRSGRRASACAASTSRRTRRTSARPTSRAARGTRCGRRAPSLELPVHFHIGASLTTMNFFGDVPVGLARRRHEARDRRHAALHRQRARRRQHHLLGHARPVSRS